VARIGTQLAHKQAREALKESEERYAWRLAAPTMAFGDWNVRPMSFTSLLVGRPCWAMKMEKIGEKPEEWFDGSMTRIENESRKRLPPIKRD